MKYSNPSISLLPQIRRLSNEDLRDMTASAVGQLHNIVRSQTTNGLSTPSSLPEKKQDPHHPSPSPLPSSDSEASQTLDQSNDSAMKPSPVPHPPEYYQPILHHHHPNNTTSMRRYPTMPPLDPSQIPQMYTTPPPAIYQTQNPCYTCFPVSGMPGRYTRCPSHMYCLTQLQTLRLDDNGRQGSQSSSSDSTGSRSPPETPPAAPWINNNTSVTSSPTSTGAGTDIGIILKIGGLK